MQFFWRCSCCFGRVCSIFFFVVHVDKIAINIDSHVIYVVSVMVWCGSCLCQVCLCWVVWTVRRVIWVDGFRGGTKLLLILQGELTSSTNWGIINHNLGHIMLTTPGWVCLNIGVMGNPAADKLLAFVWAELIAWPPMLKVTGNPSFARLLMRVRSY